MASQGKMRLMPIPKTIGEPLSTPFTIDTNKPTKPLTDVADRVIKKDKSQAVKKRRFSFHKPGSDYAFKNQNKQNRSGGEGGDHKTI